MKKINLEKPLQQMLDALDAYSIDLIEIDFDGSCDDGQFTDIRFVRKGKNDDGSDDVSFEDFELHSQHQERFRISKPEFQAYFDADPLTLRRLVEAVAWNVMRQHFPGWEVNDGSYGVIEINPKDGGSFSVDLNLRSVDSYDLESAWGNAHG